MCGGGENLIDETQSLFVERREPPMRMQWFSHQLQKSYKGKIICQLAAAI